MRAAIATVPDGTYTNVAYCDGFDAPLKLAVTMVKAGDGIHVDWAGTDPESPRGINVVLNYTHAYVTYALKCALCPRCRTTKAHFGPSPSPRRPARSSTRSRPRRSPGGTSSAISCPASSSARSRRSSPIASSPRGRRISGRRS
jgi:hypothetical protein